MHKIAAVWVIALCLMASPVFADEFGDAVQKQHNCVTHELLTGHYRSDDGGVSALYLWQNKCQKETGRLLVDCMKYQHLDITTCSNMYFKGIVHGVRAANAIPCLSNCL